MKDSYLKEVIKNLNLDIAEKTQVNDDVADSVDSTYSASKIEELIADIDLSTKQDALVSGTNIKTINSTSLLGSGNIVVGGGSFSGDMDDIPDGTTYVKTHNDFTDALETKLSNLDANAEQNVNADWTALSGDAEILNKPTIPVISDDAYDATSWNNNLDGASKNAIRDKFESLSSGGLTQPQIMARTLGC